MSQTRKLFLASGAIVVLAVAGLTVFLLTFDANRHRGLILAQLGRAVVPFNIRGTLAQPKFSLDVKRMAEMRLSRGRTSPAGNVRDILDRLRKRRE